MKKGNDHARIQGQGQGQEPTKVGNSTIWTIGHLYAIARPSVCRLSVCNVVRYTQPLEIFVNFSGTLAINFTEIVPGEPHRLGV